jgi:ubiquinone/menaquinone biosynthesis C-methylase UbiE
MSSPKRALNAVHSSLVSGRRVGVLAQHLAARLPRDSRVLDVGAGDGALAAKIMQLRPDVTIEGIDVSIRPKVRIPVGLFDGVHIPTERSSFDCVMLVDVLHHAQDAALLLREAVRVTRRQLLIKDHVCEGILASTTLRFMDYVGNWGHDVAVRGKYFSETEWRNLISQARLVINEKVDRLDIYPFPFTHIFDRRLHVLFELRKLQ